MGAIAGGRLGFLDPLTYGYSNARVRASRTLLVKKSQIAELIDVRTMPAAIELLERTPYKQDLVAAGPQAATLEHVELALGRHFARIAQKIRRITPKQDRGVVDAFLYRWDAHNLRALLLSKKAGKEQPHLYVPAGSLADRHLLSLAAAHDVRSFLQKLRATPFGAAFFASKIGRGLLGKKMQPGFESAQDAISAFEMFYFWNLENAISPRIKDGRAILLLSKAEIDAKNISTMLRLRKAGLSPEEALQYAIDGGTLSKSQMAHIAKLESVSDAIKFVSKKFPVKVPEKHSEKVSALETGLEKYLAISALRTLRRSMLSVGAIIGFLFLKEEEMNNIRKAVRSKTLGLTKEQVLEMLVEV